MSAFMDTALMIAYNRMGKTSPNPPVGAVIAKNGKLLSTGGTGPFGGPHAEAEAIGQALRGGADLRGAEIHVSLEPCSHYGKTPPCAEAIVKAGISRAYIALTDPNPIVSGNGARVLREGGVDVVFAKEYAERAYDIIRPFKKYIHEKKPFILYKSAVTLDGRTDAVVDGSKRISSARSRYITHRLRSKVDAVIVGKNTVLLDDPSLNVRFDEFESEAAFFAKSGAEIRGRNNAFLDCLVNAECEGRDPLRVIMGLSGEIGKSAKIFSDDNYLIIETEDNYKKLLDISPEKKDFLTGLNIFLTGSSSPEERTETALRELGRRGIMFAMLEGGGRLAGSFWDSDNIDQFLYFIAPVVSGAGRPSLDGRGTADGAARLADISSAVISDDILFCGYKDAACLQAL
ncbi:MAG: bifunctional diaminohydroxyphosphoribosylaminopyrimidine deaminase/5-amino-6-(5-phosphoribosylamino)uracil reductase RibD [Spirochaetia bacterium]|jgi:diaminohydroxyphosphoribosylaminopyrimidine deaminase/5-amino-6-(5-phosphoribosylamino)uracil reductase|nr:bifunctional diaminohydroxyphosphoribosylaminopyrimidine deaminase/5-amino-6-(5-phosphoribosylamino)uracil reductase RibD [Spirochaetia bacterium]